MGCGFQEFPTLFFSHSQLFYLYLFVHWCDTSLTMCSEADKFSFLKSFTDLWRLIVPKTSGLKDTPCLSEIESL